MLVALCEEAVDTLSSMNHPEGDCPLCLYPLVPEGEHGRSLPFMKLMSCFHCFHCDCFIRWLKWILEKNEGNSGNSGIQSSAAGEDNQQASDVREMMGDGTESCPVCRKIFLAKDIEHVLNLVNSGDIDTDVDEKELNEKLLQSDFELSRRQKFEAILELQQQHGGLIEPPKDNVLFSRISIQDLVREAELETNGEAIEHQNVDEDPELSGSSQQAHETANQRRSRHNGSQQSAPSGSRGKSYVGRGRGRSHGQGQGRGHGRHSGMRKHGRGNPRPEAMQWTRKD